MELAARDSLSIAFPSLPVSGPTPILVFLGSKPLALESLSVLLGGGRGGDLSREQVRPSHVSPIKKLTEEASASAGGRKLQLGLGEDDGI